MARTVFDGMKRAAPVFRAVVAMMMAVGVGACELQQKDPIEPEEVLVVEGRLVAGLALDGTISETTMMVLLHRTLGLREPGPTDGAIVRMSDESGDQIQLPQVEQDECFVQYADSMAGPMPGPVLQSGSCYKIILENGIGQQAPFEPGEVVSLEVTTPVGEVLVGRSRIPGHYELQGGFSRTSPICRVDPDSSVRLSWSPSEETWAYFAETTIGGLRQALAPQGIEAPDGLYLTGLSVSQNDVDIVFPSEFGIFDRFDLDRDLAAVLQAGLPAGVTADLGISALDRNYVNWARGGNFNPSGAVRIPSVTGDGTGVFGTAVQYRRSVVAEDAAGSEHPPCEA